MPPAKKRDVCHVGKEEAVKILNAMWYTLAQRLVERIIEETGLDEERAAALRRAALRPMDFRLELH